MNNWSHKLIEKENYCVIKSYLNGELYKSFRFPTNMYPLPNGNIKVFTHDSTELITDKKVIAAVDKVVSKIGKCFYNTNEVSKQLKAYGIDYKCYSGWIKAPDTPYPAMHAWIVVDDNKVIDLTPLKEEFDDSKYVKEHLDIEKASANEIRRAVLENRKNILKLPNSEVRNLGKVEKDWILVGCEANADIGKGMLEKLLNDFPNHEAYSNFTNGSNSLMKMAEKEGL